MNQVELEDFSTPLVFDRYNRMKFHEEVHFCQGKLMRHEELVYLCKYWEFDGQRRMSYALGRTESSLAEKVTQLKKEGDFLFYKNFDWWNEPNAGREPFWNG